MRSFACQQCGQLLFFDNTQCLACGSFLGFLPNEREIVVFDQGAGVEFRRRFGDDGQFWRCLNASWGCNWMVATTDGNGWCQSCH